MKINFCVSVPSISVRRFYTLLAESHKCDVGITTLDESDVVIMDSPTPDEIAMNFSVKRILRIIATQGSFGVKLRAVFLLKFICIAVRCNTWIVLDNNNL